MTHVRQSGFSLVELAIVIAIIGLLAGGIIGGQAMIKNGQMNSVFIDANRYADAKQQFRDKYGSLPGDMATATQIWGRADGGAPITANCSPLGTASSDGVLTCNGNGDNIINGQGTGANTEPFENFRAWQHMSAAGFITGMYTGVNAGGTASGSTVGVNVPKGALTNTGYFMWSWGIFGDDGTFFDGDYNNAITFGASTASGWPDTGALTGAEAYALDVKGDDGLPGRGEVRAIYSSRTACNTTTSSATAAYVLNNSTAACTLVFMRGYRNKSTL